MSVNDLAQIMMCVNTALHLLMV